MTDQIPPGYDASALGPGDDVLTRDVSSGRIHRRIRIGDNLATMEGCNLDQAGAYTVVGADALANAEPGELCERCFKPIGAE